MKLYRGIVNKEFEYVTPATKKRVAELWKQILKTRSCGNTTYPEQLNKEIIELHYLSNRLLIQNFTDNIAVAKKYARDNSGIVVKLDVSQKDILKYFTIEFQNFAKRREKFDLVYTVHGSDVYRFAKKWKLSTI